MVAVVLVKEEECEDGNNETALTLGRRTAVTRRRMCVVSTTASLRCVGQEVSVCHQTGPFGMAGARLRAHHHTIVSVRGLRDQRPCTSTLMDGAMCDGRVDGLVGVR